MLIDNDVFNEHAGGLFIHRATGEFAVELTKLGHRVELFQTKIKRWSRFHTFNVCEYDLKFKTQRRFRRKTLTYFVAYIKAIRRLFRTDFLYLYYPTNFHYLAIVCIIFRKKYGLNIRGEKGIRTWLSRFLIRRASVVCTVSDVFTEYARSIGGHAVTQRPALAFGFEDIALLGRNKRYEQKQSYSLLYVGRLDLQKGLIELLAAVCSLVQDGYEVSLNIVGDGADRTRINDEIHALGITERVRLCEAVDDKIALAKFYNDADIFVLPSYHEGFPRVLYEAMITGLPIVTTIVGGMSALMQDGFNCIEISPRSCDDLINKLVFVFENYHSISHLATNGRATVENYLSDKSLSHAVLVSEAVSRIRSIA